LTGKKDAIPVYAKQKDGIILKKTRKKLQFLDFDIPKPNRITVVLQTDKAFFCNPFGPAGE